MAPVLQMCTKKRRLRAVLCIGQDKHEALFALLKGMTPRDQRKAVLILAREKAATTAISSVDLLRVHADCVASVLSESFITVKIDAAVSVNQFSRLFDCLDNSPCDRGAHLVALANKALMPVEAYRSAAVGVPQTRSTLSENDTHGNGKYASPGIGGSSSMEVPATIEGGNLQAVSSDYKPAAPPAISKEKARSVFHQNNRARPTE